MSESAKGIPRPRLNRKLRRSDYLLKDVPTDIKSRYKAWCSLRGLTMRSVMVGLMYELVTSDQKIYIDTTQGEPIEIHRVGKAEPDTIPNRGQALPTGLDSD